MPPPAGQVAGEDSPHMDRGEAALIAISLDAAANRASRARRGLTRMLVLRRKAGEAIVLNGVITIHVLAVEGERVKLGISAPPEVVIVRSELLEHQGLAGGPGAGAGQPGRDSYRPYRAPEPYRSSEPPYRAPEPYRPQEPYRTPEPFRAPPEPYRAPDSGTPPDEGSDPGSSNGHGRPTSRGESSFHRSTPLPIPGSKLPR